MRLNKNKILIDTHILLWWLMGDSKLKEEWKKSLDLATDHSICLSVISLFEIALLVSKARIVLKQPLDTLFSELENHSTLDVLPLTGKIISDSVSLGSDFHSDPADRLIVATSRVHSLPLMTSDTRIRSFSGVNLF